MIMRLVEINDEDKKLIQNIAMTLIENKLLFGKLAEAFEMLSSIGINSAHELVNLIDNQVRKIDEILGVRND